VAVVSTCSTVIQIGGEQTPAFLGEIEGGITLPKLIRAANDARFFPD